MKRQLVQLGKHTLMAAIPSTWVQKHKLKKGDALEFSEVENKLIITSTNEIYERKTEIHLPSSSIEVVWRMVQPVYTSGYDEVKIYYNDNKAIENINRSVQLLIGFEIIETKKDYILIKSISKNLDEEFEVILRRTFIILNQMISLMNNFMENKEKGLLHEIDTLEQTLNKYTLFLKRIINRTGYKFPHYMYLIITFLELTGNHIHYLYRYFKKNNLKIEIEAKKGMKQIEDYYSKVYDLFYNFNNEKFKVLAEEQPHFKWFEKIKDFEIRSNEKAITEYLVLVSRQIAALHI